MENYVKGQYFQFKSGKDLISVIIPTFNAQERLLLLLKSLENQSIKSFEVIVVDDGSTDGTRLAVTKLIKRYPVSLRYYYLDNTDIFGAGIARNYGAKQAKGRILLFLDQDCVAEQNLIKNHIEHHKTKDIILGYFAGYGDEGKCYDFLELKDYVRQKTPIPIIKEFRDSLFREDSNADVWKCFASGHFSIKKEIFKDFNFDEKFIQWGGQDVDLGYRLFKDGKRISFERDCIVYNSSECPKYTKKKALSLLKCLIYTYKKYHTEDIKLYCFERFYHVPLKFRGGVQLIFKDNNFEICKSQTRIEIDANCHALVVLGVDFQNVVSTIEELVPLMRSIYFDVNIIKVLDELSLSNFRDIFYRLIKVLRDNKVLINLDDIRRQSLLAGVRILGPKRLGLYFYNKCNSNCLYCFFNSPLVKKEGNLSRSLDLRTIEKILEQAYEIGVEVICLSSDGEPFISPDTPAILEIIAQRGFELHMITNGTMIKEKHFLAFEKINKSINIMVSFGASKKTTYQKLHRGRPDNYDAVLKSLMQLSLVKRKKKVIGEKLTVGTIFIITQFNYREMSDYVRLLKDFSVDCIYFKFPTLSEKLQGVLMGKIDIEEFKKEVLKAKFLADKLSIATSLDSVLQEMDADGGFNGNNDIEKCSCTLPIEKRYEGWFFGKINSRGDYFICCSWRPEPVGNILQSSLKDFLFSDQMKNQLGKETLGNNDVLGSYDECYRYRRMNWEK